MIRIRRRHFLATAPGWLGIRALTATGTASASAPGVQLHRLPSGGVQPAVAVDGRGALSVAFLSGAAPTSDVLLQRREADDCCLTPPVRVNRTSGAAVAVGSIRGVRLAVDSGLRLHAVWNGSANLPKPAGGGMSLAYARSGPGGRDFGQERDLLGSSSVLDGGAAVCRDGLDRVHVVWHARWPGAPEGEEGRDVWVSTIESAGGVPGPGRRLGLDGGVCGCCSLAATGLPEGGLAVVYRIAEGGVRRDARMLWLDRGGRVSGLTPLGGWTTGTCPMSQPAVVADGSGVIVAWETAGVVRVARVKAGDGRPAEGALFAAGAKARHPALARSASGHFLVAWTEGTGWQRGGGVSWCVLDPGLRPVGETRSVSDLPVWGTVAAACVPGRNEFEIFY